MAYIIEIKFPGTRLEFESKEFELQAIIQTIESSFTEAITALNLFEIEKRDKLKKVIEYKTARSNKLEEVRMRYRNENKSSIFEEFDIVVRREMWKDGILPEEYSNSLISIYAKSFLFSLDTIYKLIKALCTYNNIPKTVIKAKKDIISEFPNLIDIRNSAHHIEDRVRGLGRYDKEAKKNKKIKLKAIDNQIVKSNNGALVSNSLIGNKYGYTTEEGYYKEIEVSIETLNFFRNCIQEIINAFKWSGPSRIYPW